MAHKNDNQRTLAIIVIVAFICICGGAFLFLRGNISLGNSAAAQKQEYEQQKAIARKKYGDVSSSESQEAKSSSTTDNSNTTSSQSSSTKAYSSSTSTTDTDNESSADTNYTTYIVKSGDTLSAIATKYNITVDKLTEINDLESKVISVGQSLKVPATQTQDSQE